MFLVRTAKGPLKRGHLAEAISTQGDAINNITQLASVKNQWKGSHLPPQLNSASAVHEGLEGSFLDHFLATEGPLRFPSPLAYLKDIVLLSSKDSTLKPCLHALKMTLMGRMASNQALSMQGKNEYSQALFQVYRRLSGPKFNINDGLLASIQLLCMYEVSFDNSRSTKAQLKRREAIRGHNKYC